MAGQLNLLVEQTAECVRVVWPVIDYKVRRLCVRKYRGHPRGCPNYGARDTCPPKAPLLDLVLDLHKPVYCVWNKYNLGEHVDRLKRHHPAWSVHQLRCCLYWQGGARKQLRNRIAEVSKQLAFEPVVLTCPEACGVNVTRTMKSIGIELEWPPERFAYQVALVGSPPHMKRNGTNPRGER